MSKPFPSLIRSRLAAYASLLVCAALLAGAPASAFAAVGTSGSQATSGHQDVTGWSVQALPVLGLQPSGNLTAVSCLSAASCVGVGYSRDAQGIYLTMVERWEGTAWSIEPSPNPRNSNSAFLTGVRCFDAESCIAVGDYVDPSGRQLALAERWNGHRWVLQPIPTPAGQGATYLTSLACASSDACTAVGYANSTATSSAPIAEQWDGSAWNPQSVPAPSGGNGSRLKSVSCSSPTACVAVGGGPNFVTGQPLAALWDGASWTLIPPAAVPGAQTGVFNAVSCPSTAECFAVGGWNGPRKNSGAMAERWDGSAWVVQSTPTGRQDELKAVSCSSTAACLATGDAYGSPVAMRWDGAAWIGMSTTILEDAGISCSGPTACTTVGGTDGNSSAVAWDGSSWTNEVIQYRLGASYSSLRNVSCASDRDCMAVGEHLTSAGHVAPLIERWNGDSWRVEATSLPDGAYLSAVSCVSEDDCTVVGSIATDGGLGNNAVPLAVHWNGSKWQVQPTPAPPAPSGLQYVSCTRTGADGQRDHSTVCSAVGVGYGTGIAERWDGVSWQLQDLKIPSGGRVELQGISCATVTECVSVGKVFIDPVCSTCTGDPTLQPPPGPCSYGCFADEHWDGASWDYRFVPSTPNYADRGFYEQLLDVSCPAPGTCFTVGYFTFQPTFAERLTGSSWAIQKTPDPSGYNSVSCATTTSCTSVATQRDSTVGLEKGLATHWDGSHWSDQPMRSPAGSNVYRLNSISCPTAHMCMTVGRQERVNYANNDAAPQLGLAELYTDGQN